MAFPAFLDTSTIFGAALNDLLLSLAERGLFRPLWSSGVFKELERNLVARGIDSDKVRYRIDAMRRTFPDAEVVGYDHLVEAMTSDPGDRHVLAAAVRANAEVLVTFNLRHFPEEALEPYDIEARHPDDFLLDQIDVHEQATLTVLRAVVTSYERPALTFADYLALMRRANVPKFADRVERLL